MCFSGALSGCQTFGNAGDAALSDKEQGLIAVAESSRKSGERDIAMRLYGEAAMASTGSVKAHLALAEMYGERRQTTEQIAVLERALVLQPAHPEVFLELALVQLSLGKPALALEKLETALSKNPRDARALNGKAVALDELGRTAEAQETYRQALEAAGTQGNYIRNNLALSHVMHGQYDEAIALLEPMATATDANATVRQNLAMAYGLKGDESKARAWASKDLTPAQVNENIRFYARYRERYQARLAARMPSAQAAPTTAVSVNETSPQAGTSSAVTSMWKPVPMANPKRSKSKEGSAVAIPTSSEALPVLPSAGPLLKPISQE